MEFYINSIAITGSVSIEALSNIENDVIEVEMGLSGGELRQSLLDRLRVQVERGTAEDINANFKDRGFEINAEFLRNEEGKARVLEDIDKVLYELTDEELNKSIWIFQKEIILIEGK